MKFTFAPESTPLDGYTIKRGIHRGGFGEVYYALSDAGKEVALKLLNNNLEVELRGVSQCLNLTHPNLVTIFDMKQDSDGDHWIVMEYVSGECLDKVVAKHPAGMPMEQVLRWLDGMTSGLAFLHDRGIVHRDLKPANIFSDASGVKIGDVGLSKFISESRRSAQTQSVGTVYYMAPEVARGRYGREVDVYALGVILYELITGTVPFNGQTTAEILMKHLSDRPDLTPIPDRLRPVLARALEKDPERRIADANQLAREFRDAVQGRGPATPPPPPMGYTRARPTTPPPKPLMAAQFQETHVPRPPAIPQQQVPPPATLTQGFKGLHPFAKCAIGGFLFLLVARVGGGIGGMAMGGLLIGAIAYAAYVVWTSIFGRAPAPNPAPVAYNPPPPVRPDYVPADKAARRAKAAKAPVFRRAKVVKPKPLTPATVRKVGFVSKMSQLTGSMVLAAIFSTLAMVIMAATGALETPAQLGLFNLITLVASWATMTVSKLTEGSSVGGFSRRILQGITGVGIGIFAFLMNTVLLADVPLGDQGSPFLDRHEMMEHGQIAPALFGLFFGLLFFCRRWSWHADAFRSGRLRISTALITLFVGFMASMFSGFDLQWGMTWALAITCTVQLSSKFIPADQRQQAMMTSEKKVAA